MVLRHWLSIVTVILAGCSPPDEDPSGALDADDLLYDGDDGEDEETDREGRWRELPRERRTGLTDEQLRAIEELEGIGYASGSEEAEGEAGVTFHEAGAAHDGLNLVVSGHAAEAYLLDMDGAAVHRWAYDFRDAFPKRRARRKNASERTRMWRRAYLLENGDLLAIYEGNGMIRIDRDSQLVWAYAGLAHHDVDVDGEGRAYVLTRVAHLVPRINADEPILEDFVTVLDLDDGTEIGSLSIVECFESSPFRDVLGDVSEKGGDIFHTNTLEFLDGSLADTSPLYKRGNLLISIRRLDLLAILDPEQRTVVWTRKGSWREQHQPVLLDTGNMLLFDNNLPARRRSQVLELDPLTGDVVWSYAAQDAGEFFSKSCGSCQRLPNGNTLITESDYGRAFEVTVDGEIVWEFVSPYRAGASGELVATLFEVIRLERDSVDAWLR